MKAKLIWASGLAAAAVVYFAIPQAEAQTGVAPQAAGTPPVGRLVEITLVAWPLSTVLAGRVSGTLLSMTGDWVVVKEGTFEHWIPKEKIMDMKASR